jgi:hypothetical protein
MTAMVERRRFRAFIPRLILSTGAGIVDFPVCCPRPGAGVDSTRT